MWWRRREKEGVYIYIYAYEWIEGSVFLILESHPPLFLYVIFLASMERICKTILLSLCDCVLYIYAFEINFGWHNLILTEHSRFPKEI